MDGYFIPVLIFVAASSALAIGLLIAGSALGPRRASAVKQMPYESGMDPIHDTHRRFDVRFHLVAIAFLLFDVELLFLYPWAVASRDPQGLDAAVREAHQASAGLAAPIEFSRLLVFGEVMVFIVLLAVGLAYAWRRGVFQWR
jgi:NADH-quinone oxidoreductase subunit A